MNWGLCLRQMYQSIKSQLAFFSSAGGCGEQSGERANSPDVFPSLPSEPTPGPPPASAEPGWAPVAAVGPPWGREGRAGLQSLEGGLSPARVFQRRREGGAGFPPAVTNSCSGARTSCRVSCLLLCSLPVSAGQGAREEDPRPSLVGQGLGLACSGIWEEAAGGGDLGASSCSSCLGPGPPHTRRGAAVTTRPRCRKQALLSMGVEGLFCFSPEL